MLNLGEIESLGSDTRSDHDVLLARLEGLDGVLALLLGCEGQRQGSATVEREGNSETYSCYRGWRQPRLPSAEGTLEYLRDDEKVSSTVRSLLGATHRQPRSCCH